MSYCCEQDDRRQAVRRMKGLNGLDYLEVSDDQLSLQLYFLGKLPPQLRHKLDGDVPWLRIEGGRRVIGIKVTGIEPHVDPDPEIDDFLTVHLDRYGDFSTYTLRLVGVDAIDPHYDRLDFSFKVDCPSDLDCEPVCACVPPLPAEPEINYLAKDYQSFRQLILDRLAVLVPDWKESHAADIGITLVELLAYVGDQLSYYQDAVATEAYLDTARQRISVRRHVRLVDYALHEGCNARTWVCIESDADFPLPAGTAFITRILDARAEGKTVLGTELLADLPSTGYEVFEAMGHAPVPIRAAHSRIEFYTWGEKICCLEKGCTSATLLDAWGSLQERPEERAPGEVVQPEGTLQLQAGDVLVFEEVTGPKTGLPEDADPARRHAVRLTKVTRAIDTLLHDARGRPIPYLEVEWAAADALPFTFCLSAIGPAPECAYLQNISVARGNVVLVDHGRTILPEPLGTVPAGAASAVCDCVGSPGEISVVPGPFRPRLERTRVTFGQPLAADDPSNRLWQPAATRPDQYVRLALPQVSLAGVLAGQREQAWQAVYDLLASGPDDRHFVVEIDNEGAAHLRFGDGELGFAPAAGTSFAATYRIGNGKAGNVGAETIAHLVLDGYSTGASTLRVRNPLPARGGTEPEPLAEARLYAPHLLRKKIERAITADDYRTIAERRSELQRAAAELRWTGSWYEACVAVDPLGSEAIEEGNLAAIAHFLEQVRRIGHDLSVVQADYVPLDLKLHVCAFPHFERADIKAALLEVFSARLLPGGKRGFFHPDRLSFGDGVTLSSIVAAAQAVPGVQCAMVVRLQRLYEAPNHEIDNGILPLRSWEIAQLDNDPSFPERGRLEIVVEGGR
jgi:hypothetical protein